MYSFHEVRIILARCRNFLELERACEALLYLIDEGTFSESLEQYTRIQAHVRFRQLKV